MFEIFILAILIFILSPIIRIVYTLWKTTRKFKKQFRDFSAGADGQQSSTSYSQSRNNEYTDKSKKKIFDRNDGEYVEFEEVKEERTVTPNTSQDSTNYDEGQVSDAKFEELK